MVNSGINKLKKGLKATTMISQITQALLKSVILTSKSYDEYPGQVKYVSSPRGAKSWDVFVFVHCITSMYCIVLYCIVLYCIVLYCIVLYCMVWYEIYRWRSRIIVIGHKFKEEIRVQLIFKQAHYI